MTLLSPAQRRGAVDFRQYPTQAWDNHMLGMRNRWEQGQHILISGPTGSGKSTMAMDLLDNRANVVFMVSKMKDPLFEKEFKQYERFKDWPKGGPKFYQKRVLLWPSSGKTIDETVDIQREVFDKAIQDIARRGNYAVVIDESLYMTDPRYAGFHKEVGYLFYTGRSAGITMVSLTQRPAWIPKIVYSSVSHAYIAKTRDKQDTDRLSELGGIDSKEVAYNLRVLPTRHDYVYVNPLGDAEPRIVNTRK